jgi:hypothetical protein
MKKIYFAFILIVLWVNFISCKKDKLLTDPSARVSFSQDSVLFDTVFTTIGSATRQIRVRNLNSQKINLSTVRLEQGTSSQFIMNVDGVSGKEVANVEILANDSVFIFIQVKVNPTLPVTLSPFIIQDKILFDINGNQQSVALEAWGQDAHYHYPNKAIQYQTGYLPYSTVSTQTNVTVTWGGGTGVADNRPHVIYGWLVVDSLQKLVINQGVKVYFHQNAGLWVYRYGTLQVNGTYGNEVTFQGDRREADYTDLPGQWDRIWINEGHTDNYINYAIIKNGFIGLQANILLNASQPTKVKLTNTIIKNCSKWGLYTSAFNIWAANNIICNCKEYCAAITNGGNAVFLHNTFANYFNKDGGRGTQPCVHVDNYDGTNISQYDSLYFGNCIIDGSAGNELEFDVRTPTFLPKIFQFNSCLLKTSAITGTTSVTNVYNQSAQFVDVVNYNFQIGTTSTAKGIGTNIYQTPYPITQKDITGLIPRDPLHPSAGAYE